MIKKGLGYVVGNGEAFFGKHYTSALNSISLSNYKDYEYVVYYSIDTVDNTKKTIPLSYEDALKERDRIINETDNLVQLWLYCDNIKHIKFGGVINQKLKQTYENYDVEFNLRNFKLAVYNKNCFIVNHNDGIDEHRIFGVIFYLSKDWETGMGGELVITDNDGYEIIVEPKFGNFVIFDFKEANIQHRVNKIVNDTFDRTSLIQFVYKL
jgi:Rps23 Pro-64 3,4-dihydroxylase Tpa1-like proline 4-hydroxylase